MISRSASGGEVHLDIPSQSGSGRTCLDLDARHDAARVGRQFVSDELAHRGALALVDDAALVAGELLANARHHGQAPIAVCVAGDATLIRIEVRDGSTRSPVRPGVSTGNMTGRGLTLVDALSRRWGVQRHPDGGKVVWAEIGAGDRDVHVDSDDDPLVRWADAEPGPEQRHTVVLGNVPTDLLIQAKAHVDNLVREFSLAAAAGEAADIAVPEHLARLIETVVYSFSDARDAIKRQALAAARRGDAQTTLVLNLPASAAESGEAYLGALDEADVYSRAARLLTLETPPEHRLFRRWYVEAVVRQLRQLAAGHSPDPVTPFEDVLVAEVRRLTMVERVSQRAARLQRVTAALVRSRTPEDVAGVVVSEGVHVLGAFGGSLLVPAKDGEHLAVPGAVGYRAELVGALREERLDAPLPAATALRTGQAIWLETQQDRDREFPALRGFEASTVAICAVPLIISDRIIGALRFSFNTRKLFDEDERAFVLALAAQTAQTLQRSELYEAEREAALDLQRALLPADVPAIDGWDIATYYSPAGDQEAGGDFYDVICLADGRFVAVVGDVMGRGVHAAAAMAEIRSTIRAYTLDDPDPISVFTRTDRFFAQLGAEQLVTVLYLLIDPATGAIEIANAGHPPPLIVDSRTSTIVATEPGPPFGITEMPRASSRLVLPQAMSLIALTDGLVERRGEDIDEGFARVLSAVAGKASWPARSQLNHVVTVGAGEQAHDDDVTVLVLRRE